MQLLIPCALVMAALVPDHLVQCQVGDNSVGFLEDACWIPVGFLPDFWRTSVGLLPEIRSR
jgi:hypothetical protein